MKKITLLTFILSLFSTAYSQTPTKCLEIESILADACVAGGNCATDGPGTCSCEGENEMVRFKVGPSDINIVDLYVNWPNNSFQGIATPDATTAANVLALNSTIVSCGYIKEPVGGVLPSGKNILLITSTDFCTAGNSFAQLTDTLYVIFQTAGNTQGHFGNYSSTPGIRELVIGLNSGTCYDTVQYDKSLLINVNGGYGGATADKDGARIDYDWAGNATYANNGCQAPVNVSTVSITSVMNNGSASTTICPGDQLDLEAVVNGSYTSVFWVGNDGTFTSPNALTTSYQSTVNDNAPFDIIVGAVLPCNDTIYDTVAIDMLSPTLKGITPATPNICPGQTVDITAFGGSSFLWSTTEQTASITVSTANTYSVDIFDGCYTENLSVVVTATTTSPVASVTGVQDICQGESVTVTGGGTGTYTWSDNSNGNTLTITIPGNYSLTVSDACGSDTQNFTIGDLGTAPVGSLMGNDFVCDPSETTTLIVSGGTSYSWSTGSSSSSETYANGESGYVLVINQCGQDSIPFAISDQSVNAIFTLSDTIGEEPMTVQTTNSSVNATGYNWSFGNGATSTVSSPSIEYPNNGDYTITLVASNSYGCSDTASATVQVLNPAPVIIPNIFTPNNDESNEVFRVEHPSVTKFSGAIYNRWGQKLYENSGVLVFEWDGYNDKGEAVTEGTYYYTLEATFNNGEKQSFSGAVELIR